MFLRIVFADSRKTKKFYQRLIAWWTRPGPYCHCELWFSGTKEKALTYSSLEGAGTRFTVQSLEDYDYVSITEDSKEALKVFRFCNERPRFKYDWAGIVGFTGPFKIHDDDDRFCSENCYESLGLTGWLENKEERWKVSPNELAKIVAAKYGPLKPLSD